MTHDHRLMTIDYGLHIHIDIKLYYTLCFFKSIILLKIVDSLDHNMGLWKYPQSHTLVQVLKIKDWIMLALKI
jgi:hypothetical protein